MARTASRLLSLLSLLQAGRDWPGAVLAERLEISQRTVRRDIERLRDMGYSIQATKGPDGGYRLGAGAESPPLLFDDDQVVAVAIALQAVNASGVEIEEAAARALTTMRQVMPSRLRHRLDAISFTAMPVGPDDEQRGRVAPDVLGAISTAVRALQVLRFDYAGERASDVAEPTPPRRVEPHHLVSAGGRWYLVAWDLERDDWRIFRVDRISPRIPNGPRFTRRQVPGGDVTAFLAARFKGSEHGTDWPCRGAVILHCSAEAVAPYVGDGVLEDLGPDRCRLELGSWSWVALAAALNRFDTDIDVIDPAELTDAFATLAVRNAATAQG